MKFFGPTRKMKHWQSDTTTTHCSGCKLKFDVVNRKHHCRLCGHIYCDACSNWSISVKELGIQNGRSCEPCYIWLNQKLPLLMRESIFTRINPDGADYEVRLRLSFDQEQLQWKSEQFQFNVQEQIELEGFRKVVLGQQTDAFSNAKPFFLLACCLGPGVAQYEDRSFSLLFSGGDTLDLIALSIDAMDGWLDAFKELIARRNTAASAAIKDAVQTERRRSEIQTQKNIKGKYSDEKSKYKSKYGAA